MKEIHIKKEVNIIDEPCDYLEEDIQAEYDLTDAKFYHTRDKKSVVEIEPALLEYFGSAAKINHILKSIKETLVDTSFIK